MASNNSKTDFGNGLSEIDFARRLLFEFGVDNEKDTEIDRVITRVKVDMIQDRMNAMYDPELCYAHALP